MQYFFFNQESNNNHTGSSNDDDKSSTKSSSSSSRSSRCSENSLASSGGGERDRRGEDPATAGKSGNGITSTEVCNKQEQDGRHRVEDRHEERYSKGGSDREKKDPHERRNSRERGQRDCRESEHPGHSKSRDRVRREDRRSKSRSRERERERRRSRSRDRGNRKRSHSPADRHGSSRYKRSHSRERDRNRRFSPSSHRQRSRSRDRGKSSSSSSGSSRRGSYEKKPNKLTILERLGIELRPPEAPPAVTPQQLLQKSIEQQVQQVKTSTGIELPKYYNPAAMNPARYAEQMQKRKLLWGNKAQTQEGKPEEAKAPAVSNNKWEGTTFAQDQDGKMTAKFKRLMGIKEAGGSSGATSGGPVSNPEGSDILKKQEELFNSMEMQYEVARVATHTHRGVGLGFGTFQYPR